jgi:hypothetical protein
MTKIISGIVLVISAYGIFKTGRFLWEYGYQGGLREGYVLLGLIISLVVFIISAIFLYNKSKKNNS